MSTLTREEALKVSGRVYQDLVVPELGGSIRLVSLSAGKSLEFNALQGREAKGEGTRREMMLFFIEHSIVDDQGQPLFDGPSAALFLDRISLDTITAIMNGVPKAAVSPASDPGNSGASPAGA